jgi:hypothetical protein
MPPQYKEQFNLCAAVWLVRCRLLWRLGFFPDGFQNTKDQLSKYYEFNESPILEAILTYIMFPMRPYRQYYYTTIRNVSLWR